MADINEIIAQKAIEDVERTARGMGKLSARIKEVLDASDKLDVNFNKSGKAIKNVSDGQRKLNKTKTEFEKINKKLVDTENKLATVQSQNYQNLIRRQEQMKKVNRETRTAIAANDSLKGSYDRLQAEMKQNIAAYKAMSANQRENTKEGKRLQQIIRNQNAELKRMDASLGNFQRNVGNYKSALSGLGRSLITAFGVGGGAFMFVSLLRNSVGIMKEFDTSLSNLASVLGKTKEEIKDLEREALRLGATTEFTASQVAGLETELAKLGFTSDEILASTDAVLKFASATGADMSEAAAVAGASLRAMTMNATEMERVVSVLAVSTTKSALDFSKLQTGLSTFLPVAKAFNFSIEEAVALFGSLANAGFDASSAATATRNILLNLADTNGELAQSLGGSANTFDEIIQGLITLREEGIDLAGALELTDKRSVAAFSTFLSGAEDLAVLKESITDVKDELDDLVETKTDNLAGALKRLQSAWEGMILSGRGAAGVFQSAIDRLAGSISMLGMSFTGSKVGGFFANLFGIVDYNKIKKEVDDSYLFLEEYTSEQLESLIPAMEIKRDQLAEQGLDFEARREQRRINIVKNELNNRAKLEEDAIKADQEQKEKARQKELKAEKKKNQELLDDLESYFEDAEELQAEFLKTREDGISDFVDNQENFLLDTVDLEEEIAQNKKDIAKETADFINKQNQDAYEKQKALREKEIKEFERKEELKRQIRAATVEAIGMIGAELFDRELQQISTRQEQLQEQKRYELELAGENADQRAKIEKKFTEQEKQLKTEQAKTEKKQAIFQIVVNTAAAVIAQLARTGFAGAIAAGALGAIQLALVASRPIPAFAKGTESAPGGAALVGEQGSELMINKRGQVALSPAKPTVMDIPSGTKIIPNAETELLLRGATAGRDNSELRQTLNDNNAKLIKAIKDKREFHFDAKRRTITERSGQYFRTYLNRTIYN